MAYKRELIINNGSLTSYKKLLKVSDVCQLLDKSKYPATQTISGVTFTNNGDGTITVNGTATANVRYDYEFLPNWDTGGGRDVTSTFLYIGCPAGGSNSKYGIYNGWMTSNYQDVGAGAFTRTTPDKYNGFYRFSYNIGIRKGYTANNLVFKPQLFDLTEMYGAGNEPKTVAEFKAKFPNEMYDYSPRCWVKSYKTGLIAKTKNLFNVNALTPYTPETLPLRTAGVYNGHIITKCAPGSSISRSNKLLKELCPDLVAGERYILHFDTNGTGLQADSIYFDGSSKAWGNGYPHVITEAELNGTVYFYGNYPSLDVATISNFQIEKGTTATDYVPYGYL